MISSLVEQLSKLQLDVSAVFGISSMSIWTDPVVLRCGNLVISADLILCFVHT